MFFVPFLVFIVLLKKAMPGNHNEYKEGQKEHGDPVEFISGIIVPSTKFLSEFE